MKELVSRGRARVDRQWRTRAQEELEEEAKDARKEQTPKLQIENPIRNCRVSGEKRQEVALGLLYAPPQSRLIGSSCRGLLAAACVETRSNMVAAARLLEEKHDWSSVRCAGHTASCLPQLVKRSQRSIQQTQFETSSGKAFQAIAGKRISERWEKLKTVSAERDNPLVLAAAIDPRFRKLKFISPEEGTRVQSKVEVLGIKEAKAETRLRDDPEELQQKKRGHISGGKSALDNLLHSDTDSVSEEEEETREDKKFQMVRRKVQMFFTEPPIGKKEDPLSWWRENEGSFPSLSNLARSLLCIPATSTPAERIFSAAGNSCSQKRASLTRDHVDMLTFLNMNKLNDITEASC